MKQIKSHVMNCLLSSIVTLALSSNGLADTDNMNASNTANSPPLLCLNSLKQLLLMPAENSIMVIT